MVNFRDARTAMVDTQVRPSDVTKFPIIQALLDVPREEFVPQRLKPVSYADTHLPVANDRVILEARTFSKMLDAIDIQPDQLVLDLGCAYGYSTAVIARLAEAVVGVEEISEMAAEAEKLLVQQSADNAVAINAPLTTGDARHGPYDAIVLEGAAEVVPEAIQEQLKDGGRIVALLLDRGVCRCRLGRKAGDYIHWRNVFDSGAPVLPGFGKPRSFELNWAGK